MTKKPTGVFVIYDTVEKVLWNSNGKKVGWISSGAAKNAWNLCSKVTYDEKDRRVKVKFDDQDRYVIFELSGGLVGKLLEEKNQ